MYFLYNYDIRGSVTNITKPDGTVVKGYSYDEVGATEEKGPGSFKNDVKFTGAVHDASPNLYYMNSRFYNPTTGRFLTQDSYSGNAYEPWTQHLYSYGVNNPVNYVDPTGHAAKFLASDGGSSTGTDKTIYYFYGDDQEKASKIIFHLSFIRIIMCFKLLRQMGHTIE